MHTHQAVQKTGPSSATVPLQPLKDLITSMPTLPDDSLQRVIDLLPRLPEETRLVVAQLLAGKVNHDFALRFLLALQEAMTGRGDGHTALDGENSHDQQTIAKLTEQWLAIIKNTHIDELAQLRTVLAASAGLQIMMEAAPPADHAAWVFDAGTQYRMALKRSGMLSQSTHAMHRFSANEIRYASFTVEVTHKAWTQPIADTPLGEPQTTEQLPDLAPIRAA